MSKKSEKHFDALESMFDTCLNESQNTGDYKRLYSFLVDAVDKLNNIAHDEISNLTESETKAKVPPKNFEFLKYHAQWPGFVSIIPKISQNHEEIAERVGIGRGYDFSKGKGFEVPRKLAVEYVAKIKSEYPKVRINQKNLKTIRGLIDVELNYNDGTIWPILQRVPGLPTRLAKKIYNKIQSSDDQLMEHSILLRQEVQRWWEKSQGGENASANRKIKKLREQIFKRLNNLIPN